jgi:hypothetical protein
MFKHVRNGDEVDVYFDVPLEITLFTWKVQKMLMLYVIGSGHELPSYIIQNC